MNCTTCNQPILAGQCCLDGESHYYAKHCVAATEAAAARRCAEMAGIVMSRSRSKKGYTGYAASKEILQAVKAEFPAAFARVEEVE